MRLSMPFLISTRIPGAALTVEFLIYALGGGHGHARRGLLLQQQLFMRGIASVVLLCPGSDCHFPIDCGPRQYGLSLDDPELASLWRKTPERLVVDTFPHGWRGEIEPRFLARFEKTYWIARYTRTIEDLGSGFTRILSPYPKGQDEWGDRLAHAIHVGYIIDASHWRLSGKGNCFAVFDPEGRCTRQLLSAFSLSARKTGLDFAYHRRLDRPVDAAKLLVVGAGYHTFYELLGLEVDVRFLPIHKRHDDQFLRAGLFGLGLTHLDQLLPWMDAPTQGGNYAAMPDRSAVADALEV